LSPASNQNGPAFGLYAALSNGTVVPFGTVTSVQQQGANTPLAYSLSQNYPNPFNPSTQISFAFPSAGPATLIVYNALGQQVAVLADGDYGAGNHQVTFDAKNLSSGLYFYRLQAGNFTATKKMMLVK